MEFNAEMHQEVQQRFVQICAARGSLRMAEAIEILKPICEKYEIDLLQETKIKELIATINDDLNQYDHGITIVKYPITKEEFIVFRAVSSKQIHFLNHLSEQDRNYFRLLLMTIAVTENYSIPEIQALNLISQMRDKPLTKSRADSLLQSWKLNGYFFESDDVLYMGPRMVVEFENFLLANFPEDIKQCSLCKKIVLWDPSCNDCGSKFHSECIRKYLIKSSNCPSCQKLWNTSFI